MTAFFVLVLGPVVCCGDLIVPGGNAIHPTASVAVEKLLDADNTVGAQRELEAIALENPDLPHPKLMLAQIIFQRGDVNRGRSILERLSVEEPERFDVRVAFCSLAVDQQRWFDGWVHAQAASELEMPSGWSAERRVSAQLELALLKGDCCAGRSDWEAAEQIYANACVVGQSSALYRQLLSRLARAKFQLDKIRDCYQTLLTLQSTQVNHSPAEIVLAEWFASEGNQKRAERWFEESVTSHPQFAPVSYARWLLDTNDAKKAEGVLQGFHTDDASDSEENETVIAELNLLLAMAMRMQGRFVEAQQILSPLHQADPTNFGTSNQLALVLIESAEESQRARALQIAEVCVRTHRGAADAWATLGWIQFRTGDLEQAQQSLAIATRSGHVSRDTAYFLAELGTALGRKDQATKFRKAAQLAEGPFFYSRNGLPQR